MKRSGGITIFKGEVSMLFREPELLFLLCMPFVIDLVLKVGVPAAVLLLDQNFGFNMEPHLPFVLGFLMLVPPPCLWV